MFTSRGDALLRRVGVSIAGALTLAALAGAPARADDHPPILTFEAHRLGGLEVAYSGRYAVWDAGDQSYRAPQHGYVSIDFGECASAQPALGPDGAFSGIEALYPGVTATASAAIDGNTAAVPIAAIDLPAYGPSPVEFQRLQAFTVTRKKQKQVYVSGELYGACAQDATPGNDGTDGLGMVWTTGKVALQWKVGRTWRTAKTLSFGGEDFSWTVKASKAKSKTWRLVWSGNGQVAAGTSRTFTTLSHPSVEN